MNNTFGITHGGNVAVQHAKSILGENCEILGRNDKRGDILVRFVEFIEAALELFVEIKRGSGNQTRPYQFLPVLYWDIAGFPQQFVLGDPMEVLRCLYLADGKVRRGQHTSDALTCISLTPSEEQVKQGLFNVVAPENLRAELLAIARKMQTPEYQKVKSVLDQHVKDTEKLSLNTLEVLRPLVTV